MSYNRRDGGGKRSNDYGGGGNRRGGNYRSNYDNYHVNPWESGTSHVGNRGGSGLLPSPYQSDLNQISSAEAQLAIASNLINKIFNQSQSMQPPPLLNFGGMGSGGRMSGFNDYQNRRRSHMDGRRRSEPYKSALNRRMGSDRRNIGRNRNSDKTVSKSKKDDKDSKKDKDGEKTNGEGNKPESSDEKRDDDVDSVDSSDEKRPKDKKYPHVPAALLYCHVCSKNMWDQTSFSKHIKGRRHQIMLDGLNDKYKLQVELLRHEVKIVEQQREMDMERKKRQGKYQFREYCVMCDIHFYGNIISHRRNAQHQKLKEFLFPKCSYCHKEFSNRLEQDEHKLTWAHLQKVDEWRCKVKPENQDEEDIEIDDLINPESINESDMMDKDIEIVTRQPEEELVDVNEVKVKTEEVPIEEEVSVKTEEVQIKEEGEEKDKDEKEEGKDEATAAPKVEIKFNSIDLDPANLPKYSPALPVGQNLIKPVTGFLCRGCKKFMTEEEDYRIHCRTQSHFNNYCNLVRAKARVTTRKRREENAKERAIKAEKEDEKDESNITDDEGNSKRTELVKNGEAADANDEQMDVDKDKKRNIDTEQKDFSETDWNVVDDIDNQDESIKEEEKSQEEVIEEEEEKEEEVVPKTRTRGRGGKARRGGK